MRPRDCFRFVMDRNWSPSAKYSQKSVDDRLRKCSWANLRKHNGLAFGQRRHRLGQFGACRHLGIMDQNGYERHVPSDETLHLYADEIAHIIDSSFAALADPEP